MTLICHFSRSYTSSHHHGGITKSKNQSRRAGAHLDAKKEPVRAWGRILFRFSLRRNITWLIVAGSLVRWIRWTMDGIGRYPHRHHMRRTKMDQLELGSFTDGFTRFRNQSQSLLSPYQRQSPLRGNGDKYSVYGRRNKATRETTL